MTVYTDQNPRTGSGSKFDQAEQGFTRPEIRVTQSNLGSNSAIAYLIAALVLAVGAYLLYTNNWSTTTVVPSVTQNNTTLPAPDAYTPVPATPPAAEKTAPPAIVPAPQQPVTPVQ